MCRGLFIELNADIKKTTVKVGFFGYFWSREYLNCACNWLISNDAINSTLKSYNQTYN